MTDVISSHKAIFRTKDLTGPWKVGKEVSVLAILGGATIDLREAQLEHPYLTLHLMAMSARVTIIIPPTMEVTKDNSVEWTTIPYCGEHASSNPNATHHLTLEGSSVRSQVTVEVR